jgi:hypothetical protein
MLPHLPSLLQLKAALDVGLMPTTKATADALDRADASERDLETQHAV